MSIPRYLNEAHLKKGIRIPTTDAHLYDSIIHLNPAQLSMAREHLAQQGGLGASALYGGLKVAEPLESKEDRRAARNMVNLEHHHMARAVVAHRKIGAGFGSLFKKIGNIGRRAATHFVQHKDTYAAIGTGIAEGLGAIDEETGEAIREGVGEF